VFTDGPFLLGVEGGWEREKERKEKEEKEETMKK